MCSYYLAELSSAIREEKEKKKAYRLGRKK
jgi:hypothetical protein